MKMRKDERKLLILTYILCIGLFSNLAILSDPIDKKALIIGGALVIVARLCQLLLRLISLEPKPLWLLLYQAPL